MKIIITDLQPIEGFSPISEFQEAYGEGYEVKYKIFALLGGDNLPLVKMTRLITREAYRRSPTEETEEDQKYILALSFWDFGAEATLDIVSHSAFDHKDIFRDYVNKMGWSMEDIKDPVLQAYISLVIIAGGNVRFSPSSHLQFYGSSQDFGDQIFGSSANEIAAAVNQRIHFHPPCEGTEFIECLLQFMLENQGRRDFYEKLAKTFRVLRRQHLGALLMMKAIDRLKREPTNSSLRRIMDEWVEGFDALLRSF